MILLTVSCVLFLKENSNRVNTKSSFIFLFMIMSLLTVGSVRTYHNTVNDDPIRYYINNDNYVEEISKPTEGDMDYRFNWKNKQVIIGEMSHRLHCI